MVSIWSLGSCSCQNSILIHMKKIQQISACPLGLVILRPLEGACWHLCCLDLLLSLESEGVTVFFRPSVQVHCLFWYAPPPLPGNQRLSHNLVLLGWEPWCFFCSTTVGQLMAKPCHLYIQDFLRQGFPQPLFPGVHMWKYLFCGERISGKMMLPLECVSWQNCKVSLNHGPCHSVPGLLHTPNLSLSTARILPLSSHPPGLRWFFGDIFSVHKSWWDRSDIMQSAQWKRRPHQCMSA